MKAGGARRRAPATAGATTPRWPSTEQRCDFWYTNEYYSATSAKLEDVDRQVRRAGVRAGAHGEFRGHGVGLR